MDLEGKFEAVPILEEFYLYPDETSSPIEHEEAEIEARGSTKEEE